MKDRITQALKAAMKNKEPLKVSILRMVLAEIQRKEKEKGIAVDNDTVIKILYSMIKKGQEAAEQFQKGGRQDLAEKENQEVAIIESFLPKQFTEEEIKQEALSVIAELGARSVRELGKIMSILTKKLAGKAQGAVISRIVKEELQKRESQK